MKIKRFEASTMSDALRMIKKEFGEDAVILSAKTMKKNGGLLGNKRPRKVMVTAAVDHAAVETPNAARQAVVCRDTTRSTSQQHDEMSAYTKFSFLKNYKPITRTGKQKVRPKIVQFMTESESTPIKQELVKRLEGQGLQTDLAVELADQVDALLGEEHASQKAIQKALSQALEAMQIIEAGSNRRKQQRVVIVVGASGVGKTATVAKLAAQQIIEHQENVGIISLDNQRIAANGELQRYAEIMGVPVVPCADTHQILQAVQSFESCSLILVDTPGLSLDDHDQLENLQAKLSTFEKGEVHLLLSATSQEKVLYRTFSFYKPLNVNRLLFTKLDWAMEIGPMLNLASSSQTPISYFSDSAKVPEGVHETSAAEITALLLPSEDLSVAESAPKALTVRQRSMIQEDARYVANRNSDIFHHSTCKSVKRINADNMVLFKDPAEALGRQFKPCRMCCSELLITKPSQRQARRYAGIRC